MENIQIIRMNNIKQVINESFVGKIDAFAEHIGKSKYVVYAWLWELDNPNRRNITTDSARLIENKLGLPKGYIDKSDLENTTFHFEFAELSNYKSLLDEIIKLQNVILDNHKRIQKFTNNK